MTLEVRVWVSSIRDGWQVDRARRPRQTMAGEQLLEQHEEQWLLFYILAQQMNQRRANDKIKAQR